MENHDDISPLGIFCAFVMLFAAIGAAIIEGRGGKGSLSWVIASGSALLAGVVIGIEMIVTQRAFYRSARAVGMSAVIFGILLVILFGLVFIGIVLDPLQALW
jgi:hypothetical protein